jgi:hypothetical protein
LHNDIEYELFSRDGQSKHKIKGAYLLCDGGYHKWRTMQCPVKLASDPDTVTWSRWVESVRKDIECTFGIVKGRFRILKLPILLQTEADIGNVFLTCCALHNELLRADADTRAWEENVNFGGVDGEHDAVDQQNFVRVTRQVEGVMVSHMLRVTATLDMSVVASLG